MASEVSTIQSLKAVDAWIDVINANINGGVRTAFKSSRLKFSGSNVDVARAGNATALPLQFPEPGLTTANTVIDFSQGAITASTEDTHLAIQGQGWFKLRRLSDVSGPTTEYFYSRDGEFRWMQLPLGVTLENSTSMTANGTASIYVLVNSDGLGVMSEHGGDKTIIHYVVNGTTGNVTGSGDAGVHQMAYATRFVEDVSARTVGNEQGLQFTRFGSTVFSKSAGMPATDTILANGESTVLQKSLEASNASMTQSVPELSLAQKLFSALTKVLQTKQTNVDGVLNLVR
jgi:flagellar basal body rod protein FlgG